MKKNRSQLYEGYTTYTLTFSQAQVVTKKLKMQPPRLGNTLTLDAENNELTYYGHDEEPYMLKVTDEFMKRHKLDILARRVYKSNPQVGKVKHSVSYHDGIKTHKDGSPFFDIKTFKNETDKRFFTASLHSQGYRLAEF